MATKEYWLVAYKQKRAGRPDWQESNAVIDMPPIRWLAQLDRDHDDHENMVTWGMQITAAQYKNYTGTL